MEFVSDKRLRKLCTIYEAEMSYVFVFKHVIDISRLSSPMEIGPLFFFVYLIMEKFYLPFNSHLEVF